MLQLKKNIIDIYMTFKNAVLVARVAFLNTICPQQKGVVLIEQQYENVHYLQFSQYLAFPELIHGVFTRIGGYSEAPYKSLNTSAPPRGGGDTFHNVVRNRQLALQALQ